MRKVRLKGRRNKSKHAGLHSSDKKPWWNRNRYCRWRRSQKRYSRIRFGRVGRWSRLRWPCRTAPCSLAGTAGSAPPQLSEASASTWVERGAGSRGCPPHTQRGIRPRPYLRGWCFEGNVLQKVSEVLLQTGQRHKWGLRRQTHRKKRSSRMGGPTRGRFRWGWLSRSQTEKWITDAALEEVSGETVRTCQTTVDNGKLATKSEVEAIRRRCDALHPPTSG